MLGSVAGDEMLFTSKAIDVIAWSVVVILLLWTVTFCAIFAWLQPSVPNQTLPPWFPGVFGLIVFGGMLLSFFRAFCPFRLRVNIPHRTYQWERGIRPFILRQVGSLDDIKGFCVKEVNTRGAGARFRMLLVWNASGRAPVFLGVAKTREEANDFIAATADILRVPPSLLSALPRSNDQGQCSSTWHRIR